MSLSHFDKEIFIQAIEEKMKNFSSDKSKELWFNLWHDFVIDSALIAGAVIYDKGNMKKFFEDKISFISV